MAVRDTLGDIDRAQAFFDKTKSLCGSFHDFDALIRTAARRSEFAEVVRE